MVNLYTVRKKLKKTQINGEIYPMFMDQNN